MRRCHGVDAGEPADSLQRGCPWQQHWRHWCLEKCGANGSAAAWTAALSLSLSLAAACSSSLIRRPPAVTPFILVLRELTQTRRQILRREGGEHCSAYMLGCFDLALYGSGFTFRVAPPPRCHSSASGVLPPLFWTSLNSKLTRSTTPCLNSDVSCVNHRRESEVMHFCF